MTVGIRLRLPSRPLRLFVAVLPSAAAVDELSLAIKPVRPLLPEARWVDPATWHLTLVFCGEVPEEKLPDLTTRLGRAASRHTRPSLALAGLGGFPTSRRARVLTMRVAGEVIGLTRIADSARAAARRCGITVDDRTYRPHLTLARLREPTDVTVAAAVLATWEGSWWSAERLVLVRSHLGPVVRHEQLASWPIRAQ